LKRRRRKGGGINNMAGGMVCRKSWAVAAAAYKENRNSRNDRIYLAKKIRLIRRKDVAAVCSALNDCAVRHQACVSLAP
jgi:hypothetical protein